VAKTDARIEAFGTLDELNACLGLVAEQLLHQESGNPAAVALHKQVVRIQNELFDLGGELATLPEDRHPQQAVVRAEDVERLETEIDEANDKLPSLKSFVLPGGGMLSAFFHQARTVCRRSERRLLEMNANEPLRSEVMQYVNRLSDWLFVMGRKAALDFGYDEVLWRPGDRT
jgi:cob(I)alamin adenosyltransferase